MPKHSGPGAQANSTAKLKAPFGAANRQRLIRELLVSSAEPPWLRIYRLLLWADTTTGLAHCYESDKCQPGKPWHPRSLRFHAWLAKQMNASPRDLVDGLDWLFRRTAQDYARYSVQQFQGLLRRAQAQRAPYANLAFPEPGEDPAIVSIIKEVLGSRLSAEPSPDEWRSITQRIRDLIAVENKRKNLVGEGFEDVLCAIAQNMDPAGVLDTRARCVLSSIPGFANSRVGDKPIKVDLALVRRRDEHRTLVTAKWSIRADREQQFAAEFASYVRAKSDIRPFDYVLLTNEFDPARLVRACESSAGNAPMFSQVVHISPMALHAVYGASPEPTMQKVLAFVNTGRIAGVDDWFAQLLT